jgi:hypothetical protein
VKSAANLPVREVSTGRPLRYGTLTFHQTGFQPMATSSDLSVLRVTSDPGQTLKYAGLGLIGGGLLLGLTLSALVRRPERQPASA